MKMNRRSLWLLVSVGLSSLPVGAAERSSDRYDPTVEPAKSFHAARACLTAGEYEKALSIHEWMFKNIAALRPDVFFLHVSNLTYDWHQVAVKYPPAMKSLLQHRDESEGRMRAAAAKGIDLNSKDEIYLKTAFLEAISFNQWLGDDARSADFYVEIGRGSPEFARSIYFQIRDALLLAKHEPPPEEAVAISTDPYRIALRVRPDLRSMAEGRFVEDVTTCMDIYFATGWDEKAEKVRALALAVLDSPLIRNHGKIRPVTPQKEP